MIILTSLPSHNTVRTERMQFKTTVRTLRGTFAQIFVRDMCNCADYSSHFTYNSVKFRRHLPTVGKMHITNEYTEATSTLLTHCTNRCSIPLLRTLIHSFSSLSYDRSKASSKANSPHSAIQSFLLQMRVSSPFLKVIQ
jgi:hypothetical protein